MMCTNLSHSEMTTAPFAGDRREDRKMGRMGLGQQIVAKHAAHDQNLSHHPGDWHYTGFRQVFWLTIVLIRPAFPCKHSG
jgi:hypothetical protein